MSKKSRTDEGVKTGTPTPPDPKMLEAFEWFFEQRVKPHVKESMQRLARQGRIELQDALSEIAPPGLDVCEFRSHDLDEPLNDQGADHSHDLKEFSEDDVTSDEDEDEEEGDEESDEEEPGVTDNEEEEEEQ